MEPESWALFWYLDYQIRKFRRRRLIMYHELEQDLLREVSRLCTLMGFEWDFS